MLEKGSSSPPEPKREAAMPTLGLGACPFLCVVVGCGGSREAAVDVVLSSIAGAASGKAADSAATALSSVMGGELLMMRSFVKRK